MGEITTNGLRPMVLDTLAKVIVTFKNLFCFRRAYRATCLRDELLIIPASNDQFTQDRLKTLYIHVHFKIVFGDFQLTN
ncbi:MAG: hypothetical protein HQ474_10425 [Flammeovirgaceae bacterium]|jgi:hypothetical protein|nr:hypothetical protein [Flammeovirgaceae bacterium]